MKNKLMKTSVIALSLVAMFGCNENNQTTQTKAIHKTTKESQSVVNKNEAKRDVFRYTWLSGEEVSLSVDEEDMFAKNYYFVIDGSGSMNSSSCEGNDYKIDIAKKAVIDYSKTLTDSNIGLIVFDQKGVSERVSLSPNNEKEFENAVSSINTGSTTPLLSSMSLAYEKIKEQASRQGASGEYNLIVVTDGVADSGEDPTSIVEEMGLNSPVNIKTIGFCIGNSHSLNNKEFVDYYAARNYSSILKGLTAVQSEGEEYSEENYVKLLNEL